MIVVTGATGHIGNNLVRRLLEKGEKVRVFVRPTSDLSSIKELDVEVITGDVRDVSSLLRGFRRAKVVYHLAGLISLGRDNKRLLFETNVVGTRNVVEACLKCGVEKLVYTASVDALKKVSKGIIDETVPFDPENTVSTYGRSKAMGAMEVLEGVKRGLDAVIVSPTGVIGPFDFKPSHMGRFIVETVKKKYCFYVDGAYDFVDVRDVVEIIIASAEKGKRRSNYIVSGERLKMKHLIELVEKVTGNKILKFKIPVSIAKMGSLFVAPLYGEITGAEQKFSLDVISLLFSNSIFSKERVKREFGYSPRPIMESVKDTLSWFMERGIL